MEQEHPLRESLEQINLAGAGAARLTNELPAFARSQMLQAREFDVNPFLAALTPEIRRILGIPIPMDLDLAPAPLRVHSDPAQMETVILNIVRNARDAMPQGGRLLIRASPRRAGKTQSGGTITVESAPGRGTRFEVWIPLSAAGKGQAGSESSQTEPAHTSYLKPPVPIPKPPVKEPLTKYHPSRSAF